VKRFTVDAGHQLDQVESTFSFSGAEKLTAAVGLNKTPANKKLDPQIAVTRVPQDGALLQWVEMKAAPANGAYGTAIVLPGATVLTEDTGNELALASVEAGKPLRYYVGAAWNKAGHIASQDAWKAYVAAAAVRATHPLKVTLR
jgi:pectinesterase